MADVTISQLTKGTPTGNNVIPYSTGNSTLGVPVSAIFQNTGYVGIGKEPELFKGGLQIGAPTQDLIVGDSCRLGGNINAGFLQVNIYYDQVTQTYKSLQNNKYSGELNFNSNSNEWAIRSTTTTTPLGNNITLTDRIKISPSGAVTTPSQPFLHAALSSNNISTITGYRYIPYSFSGAETSPLVPYNKIIKQIGNNFNTSTYRYTTPVSGVYNITAGVFAGDTNGNPSSTALCEIWLVIDGNRNITLANSNGASGTSPYSGILHGSVNYYFNANQTIGIRAANYGTGSGSILTEQNIDFHTFLIITLLG